MFSPEQSVLVVIDVQGKLAHLTYDKDKLFSNIQALIKVAKYLKIPILLTEQMPEKIGATVTEVASLLKNVKPIKKTSFSCCGQGEFITALRQEKRKEIIVCGIETHVCVYQTVFDLREQQYDVQVVVDAVSSRTAENKQIALDRMKTLGADLTCTEMLATELLRTAKHEKFKEILSLIK